MTNKTLKKLQLNYYLVFLLLILTSVIGYFLSQYFSLEQNTSTKTLMQTIGIFLLLILIPLGLKLHNTKIKSIKLIEKQDILSEYTFWSNIRLLMIAIPLVINTLFYYLTQDISMLYSAAIAAIALLFCKPTRAKIEEELNLSEDNKKETSES